MPMTPEDILELREQLRDLKSARRTGAKRVVINERDVTYKSDEEMAEAIRDLEREIAACEIPPNRRRRSRSILTVFRSGR